jgi:L-2-hydroxyglutarate oxidase LhgO
VEIVDAALAIKLEPELACIAALHSPETGVVDSHRFMLALYGDLQDRGGMIAFNSPIAGLRRAQGGWEAAVGGGERQWLGFDAVVNCAGLGAQALARATEGYPAERVPRLVLAKGNYFGYSGRPAFSRLIYPVPVPGGLGVHVTLDLAGRMRFGPDVEWIQHENYDVDGARATAFYQYIREYWPRLPDHSLVPDYAGIRPKLTGPGETAADFLIDAPAQHGLERIVHLFGIESPGLTCALSLAEGIVSDLSS